MGSKLYRYVFVMLFHHSASFVCFFLEIIKPILLFWKMEFHLPWCLGHMQPCEQRCCHEVSIKPKFWFSFLNVFYVSNCNHYRVYLITAAGVKSHVKAIRSLPVIQHSAVFWITESIFCIMKTSLFKYTENFTTKKWKFSDKNSDIFIFLSKHKLWVLVRTALLRQF